MGMSREERIKPRLSRISLPFCHPVSLTHTFLPGFKLSHGLLRGPDHAKLCPFPLEPDWQMILFPVATWEK